jgi:hypothetical protein
MNKALVPSHLLVPAGTGSLDAYIQEVNRIPMLWRTAIVKRVTWTPHGAWCLRTCVLSYTWPRATAVMACNWVT